MTLADFLLARIAEDEARIKHWMKCRRPSGGPCSCTGNLRRFNDRRHAECEAKRRIVERWKVLRLTPWATVEMRTLEYVMEWLALPYENHPDYREEWKP